MNGDWNKKWEGLHPAAVLLHCLGSHGLLADPLSVVLVWSWEDLCSWRSPKLNQDLLFGLEVLLEQILQEHQQTSWGAEDMVIALNCSRFKAFHFELTKEQRNVTVQRPCGWGGKQWRRWAWPFLSVKPPCSDSECPFNALIVRMHLCYSVLCTSDHHEGNERPSLVYYSQCLKCSQITVIHLPIHSANMF